MPQTAGAKTGTDLTQAKPLKENSGVAFTGTKKCGTFDIPGDLARQWLALPNPNSRPNSDVLRPWVNGTDIVKRPLDKWIIDFGVDRKEAEAAFYEMPFEYVVQYVRPERSHNDMPARCSVTIRN
jgi:hypothetical protein